MSPPNFADAALLPDKRGMDAPASSPSDFANVVTPIVPASPAAFAKFARSLLRPEGRRQAGMTICEGVHACQELVAARPELLVRAFAAESFQHPLAAELGALRMPDRLFDSCCETRSPQGIAAVVRIPPPLGGHVPPSPQPFHVGLDGVADPGNLGTILRTCRALGLREVLLCGDGAGPFLPKTIRCAVGAQFGMLFRHFPGAVEMGRWFRAVKPGAAVFAAEPSGGANCFELSALFENSLIVFGGEARGVDPALDALPVSLPMPGGFESLNVAQAATVILFEALRRHIL